ncbi:MAG: DNA repair protein RadC [Ktedonobacteraceae bacterium]|nr:DNA repair protein RadC [Ktedonobacteraceae bacterium]
MKKTVLREQLQHDGPQSLSTEELLALIVSPESTTERVQVLRKMQKLFAECGDLQGILCADFGDICLTHGFGEHKAAQLQAVLEFAKRLAVHPFTKKYQIKSVDDVISLIRVDMMYLDTEQMRVLVLDTKNYVLANILMYQGTINSTVLRAAEIFRPAIARKAANIILCHNHPSGDACPSPEDIDVTKQLVAAGQVLDIEVLDHVIIGNPRYVSLKEHIRW